MSSWIVTIGPKHPQHWAYALDREFWDITKAQDISKGDDVYFWQSGQGLVGWTRATTEALPIEEDLPLAPWNDRVYSRRFHFELVSDDLRTDIRWGEMAKKSGITQLPSNGQLKVPSAGEEFMRGLFDQGSTASNGEYPDTRESVTASVLRRRGQPQFRRALLAAYGNTCAVTGSSVVEILEAAHIRPYRGLHSNSVPNGILLRSDIHTLFDLFLLTFAYADNDSDVVIKLSPELLNTEYAQYADAPIKAPALSQNWPSEKNLEIHHDRCAWFTSN